MANHPDPSAIARDLQHFLPSTPGEIVTAVIEILQRNLPRDGINDRKTITELWSVLDTPAAVEIYEQELARRESRDADGWH